MAQFRTTASSSNPFAAAPEPAHPEETPNILDLFGRRDFTPTLFSLRDGTHTITKREE